MKGVVRVFSHAPFALVTALLLILFAPVLRLQRSLRRRRGLRPAVVRGPTPIANLRWFAHAERPLGYRSELLAFKAYRSSDRAAFDRLFDRFSNVRGVGQLVPYPVLLWAVFQYDVFWFTFDGGLLAPTPFWWIELPLLRLEGKSIVVFPYGGDARLASKTRARGGWHAYVDVELGEEDRDERDVEARIEAFARWSNAMLGGQDNVLDLPRMDDIVRLPIDLEEWHPVETPDDGVVTVVHAPNHPHYKGTRFLRDAIERLRAQALRVELVLVERSPSDKAKAIYERADVIADQFLLGAYGYFAIEGMALGKPVLCYLRQEVAALHPEWEDSPVVNANPETLETELRRLVVDAALRRELGRRGVEYVRRVHSYEAVGAFCDALYRRVAW